METNSKANAWTSADLVTFFSTQMEMKMAKDISPSSKSTQLLELANGQLKSLFEKKLKVLIQFGDSPSLATCQLQDIDRMFKIYLDVPQSKTSNIPKPDFKFWPDCYNRFEDFSTDFNGFKGEILKKVQVAA